MKITRFYIYLIGIAFVSAFVACNGGGDGNNNQQPGPQAGPQPIVLNGELSGTQEAPPVVTQGSGTSSITISADGSTIDYVIDVNGPLSSDLTQAHIHTGAVGANGPIVFWLCTDLGNAPGGIPAPPGCTQPPVTFSGSFTAADFDPGSGLASFADAVAAMTNLNTYINVHTVTITGGELRGQIGTTPPPPGAPPNANDPVNDNFSWLGNTPLTIAAGQGVLSNDPVGAIISASDTATSGGGQVTVNADGSFSYAPALGFRGGDTFTYTIDGSTVVSTVTIQINAVVWYADNSFVGTSDGSFAAPFTTLLAAQGLAGVGDTVFVFAGDGTDLGQNAGFDFLAANQSLIGEGVGLSFQAVAGTDTVIVPVGLAPAISRNDVGNAGALVFGANSTAAGLSISSLTNEGIQVSAVGGYTIRDNSFANTAREGVRLLNVTGIGSVMNNTFSNTGREGIKLTNVEDVAGNQAVTDITATVVISGNNIDAPANVNHGIGFDLDANVATNVQATVTGNTISNSTADGINVSLGNVLVAGTGVATLSAVIDGNIISASAQEGIDMQTNTGSSLATRVNGNNASASAGVADFQAQASDASSICLELTNNSNAVPPAAGNMTFDLQNNGLTSTFQIFEPNPTTNDTVAVRGVNDIFTDVAAGACGLP